MNKLTLVVDVKKNFSEFLNYNYQYFGDMIDFIFVVHHENRNLDDIKEHASFFPNSKLLINYSDNITSNVNNTGVGKVKTPYVLFTDTTLFLKKDFLGYFDNLVSEFNASIFICQYSNEKGTGDIIEGKNIFISPEINYIFSSLEDNLLIYKTCEITNYSFKYDKKITKLDYSKNIFNFKNDKIVHTQTIIGVKNNYNYEISDLSMFENLINDHKQNLNKEMVDLLLKNFIINNIEGSIDFSNLINLVEFDCIEVLVLYNSSETLEQKNFIISKYLKLSSNKNQHSIANYHNTSFSKELEQFNIGKIRLGFLFDRDQTYIDSMLLEYIYYLNNYYLLDNIDTFVFDLNEKCHTKYKNILEKSNKLSSSNYIALANLDELLYCTKNNNEKIFIPPNANIKSFYKSKYFEQKYFENPTFLNSINRGYNFEYLDITSVCVVISEESLNYIYEIIKIATIKELDMHFTIYVSDKLFEKVYSLVKNKNIDIVVSPNYFAISKYIRKFDFAIFLGSESPQCTEIWYLKSYNTPIITFDDVINKKFNITESIYQILEIGNMHDFDKFVEHIPTLENKKDFSKLVPSNLEKKKTIVISLVAPNIIGGVEIILLNMIESLSEIYSFTIVYYQYIGSGHNLFNNFSNVICFRDVPGNLSSIEYEFENAEVILVPLISSLNVASIELRGLFNQQNHKIKALYLGEINNILERKLFGNSQVNAYNNFIKALNDSYVKINELGVLTNKNANIISQKYKNIKGVYLPNLLFAPDEIPKNYRENFIYIGRIVRADKDIFELLNIAKNLPKGCRIDVFGTGPDEEELRMKIKELGLSSKIKMCGTVDNKQIVDEISRRKALILCSVSEGLPNVIMESYFSNTPVIIYDAFTNASEIVDNGVSGFLIEKGDSKAFARKMTEIENMDIQTYNKFELGAASKVIKKEVILKQWISYIESKNTQQTVENGITIILMEDSRYIIPDNIDGVQFLKVEDGVLSGKILNSKFMFIHPNTELINYEEVLKIVNRYDVDLIQYNLYDVKSNDIYKAQKPKFSVGEHIDFSDVSIFNKIFSTEIYSDFYASFLNIYNGYNTNLDDLFYRRFYFTTMNTDKKHIYYKYIDAKLVDAKVNNELEELHFTFIYHIFSLLKYRIIDHKLLHDMSNLSSLYATEKLEIYNEYMTIYLLLKEARNV